MSEHDTWGLRSSRAMTWAWRALLLAVVLVIGVGAWVAVQLSQASIRPPESLRAATAAPPVEQPLTAEPPAYGGAATSGIRADPVWTERTAAIAGVPARALSAYAAAALTVGAEQPACGIGWNTLAGIGAIESGHGTHGGAVLRANGYPDPPIRGIALDGTESAVVHDTDGGRWDGDTAWDRAVGPMQFIPETWERWGADADGDGTADPNSIDDAALGAARYLCAGGEMSSVDGWRAAIFRYNNLESYVDDVAATANAYAARVAG